MLVEGFGGGFGVEGFAGFGGVEVVEGLGEFGDGGVHGVFLSWFVRSGGWCIWCVGGRGFVGFGWCGVGGGWW